MLFLRVLRPFLPPGSPVNRSGRLSFIVISCLLCLLPRPGLASPEAPLSGTPVVADHLPPSPAVLRFNILNSRIRDGRIARTAARDELRRLLPEVRREYRDRGGEAFPQSSWVFPLAGYDGRSLGNGPTRGYVASGYDYFQGNRHGGHPSCDIFIHDRNRDCRDDRNGRAVVVRSLTGGIVVALEREWEQMSLLRGGVYVWVYDPDNDLLVYYAHNERLFVRLGQLVRPGDPVASVGRSGLNAAKRRSPTHLHLTVLSIRDGAPLPLNVVRRLERLGKISEKGT